MPSEAGIYRVIEDRRCESSGDLRLVRLSEQLLNGPTFGFREVEHDASQSDEMPPIVSAREHLPPPHTAARSRRACRRLPVGCQGFFDLDWELDGHEP